MLRDAIKVLRQNPKTIVYLDGGHSRWHPVEIHARLLKEGGVEMAHGFALNTSNYRAMDELLPFAKKLSQLLGGAHGVIDTSRNGAGPDRCRVVQPAEPQARFVRDDGHRGPELPRRLPLAQGARRVRRLLQRRSRRRRVLGEGRD